MFVVKRVGIAQLCGKNEAIDKVMLTSRKVFLRPYA